MTHRNRGQLSRSELLCRHQIELNGYSCDLRAYQECREGVGGFSRCTTAGRVICP